MKKALVLVFALFALTACPRKNNTTTANVVAANACTYDQYGNCQIAGSGYWRGRLTVSNVTVYRQLLESLGFCYNTTTNWGLSCQYSSGFYDLSIMLQQGGYLPGFGSLGFYAYFQSYNPYSQQLYVDVYPNSNNSGLDMSYTFGAANGILDNSLRITTVYTNANHSTMTVSASFRGTQFSGGTVTSY